jgi:coatomer protein complex subunit epsilon
MADELYDIRNSFLVGNFHQVIAEGQSVRSVKKKPEEVRAFNADRDSLVARAQIALGQYDVVIEDLKTSGHPVLKAVGKLAEVAKEMATMPESGMSSKVGGLVELLGATEPAKADASEVDVALIVCTGIALSRNFAEAVTTAAKWAGGIGASPDLQRRKLELIGIIADGMLRMNRPDLAEKEVEKMKQVDDESTLAILLGGMAALRLGSVKPERYDDAASSFQEVNARCGQSVSVLNLIALANLGRGRAADAERNLLDALAKKSGDPDTVSNLAVVCAHLGKPQEASMRYILQARSAVPLSPFVRQYAAVEERFAAAIDKME